MQPEYQVLLWTIFIFMTLVGLLWKFAWGPIMHALEEREANIKKTIDDAEKRFKDADARVAEYEKKLNTAKDEAAAIIAEGKRDVEKLKDEILAEANKEAARSLERAKREIGLAKDAAVADLRNKVVDLTSELARMVIEREVKTEDHRRFIGEALEKIEKN